MIDWGRLDSLKAEIGDEAFEEVVGLFLEETDQEVAALRAGAPPRGTEASLHFLKGAALNLGLADLARLCGEGERLAASGSEAVDLALVIATYDQSRDALLSGLEARAAA